jgi:hypothetical protein
LRQLRRLPALCGLGISFWLPGAGAATAAERGDRPPSKALRDINAVLKDHDKELLAIPGVTGVYVGRVDDRKKTLCLKVMVVRRTPEISRRIPRSIEGHRVVIEESGVIRPLSGK